MTENEFIYRIYKLLRPGMKIIKPRTKTEVLRITQDGKIYYRIGETNKKFVSENELRECYRGLASSVGLRREEIDKIVGSSSPCNKTTIEWILEKCGLATLSDNIWLRQWK
jgi:hypothetical protein